MPDIPGETESNHMQMEQVAVVELNDEEIDAVAGGSRDLEASTGVKG